MVKRGVGARVVTARALEQILDEGAHSNVVVNRLRGDLGEADAAQLQRVVLSTIRHLVSLDRALDAALGRRRIADLDAPVRAVLRAGAAELLVDQGDAHGVVDSSVEAVRQLGSGRAAGLVNAVLRRLGRERPVIDDSTMPAWIVDRLTTQYGADEAGAMLAALDLPARRGVRLRTGRVPAGVDQLPGIATAGFLAPGRALDPVSVDFIDPASTAVAISAAVEPNMQVLDVAAAPGGKTAALWDAMDGTGLLVAGDVSAPRLRRARRRLERMGMAPQWIVADGRRPPFRPGSFDVVLLDAPCTGLGTLRRRPEIRHRIGPGDPARLGVLQRELLEASLELVRPGGRLVYAVCTLFAEETTEVVAGLEARPPEGLPGRLGDEGLLLAPHLTDTDGMFIAVIER